MNLVLFDPAEIERPLPQTDERARHILTVLRRSSGDTFDVGLVNGPRGKARLEAETAESLILQFDWSPQHPSPPPTRLAVGFPRPQTSRDILRDATTLGATELAFVDTSRSDPNYASSSLWTRDEWRRHVRTGAAQAFDTFTPDVSWSEPIESVARNWSKSDTRLCVLDVYGDHPHLGELSLETPNAPVAIFIGPERGWDDADRNALKNQGGSFYSLGNRVLRTETAVTSALALLSAARARADKSLP